MRLLVTGATGYLGARLCAALAGEHAVYATCRAEHPRLAGVEWIRRDLGDAGALAALPAAVDGVVHLAQSLHYRDFPRRADDMLAINVDLTCRLLEYARRAGASRFLYTSTGGIYAPAAAPLHESAIALPAQFYPATKLAAEALIAPYGEFFAACVLRLFFVYGPGQRERLIPLLAGRIMRGEAVTLGGQGDGLRLNPTHVDDVVPVVCAALREGWRGTFNVAAPEVLSIRQIALMLGSACGRNPLFVHEGGPEPLGLVPDLAALAAHVDLAGFRRFADGARDVVTGATGGAS
jgi:nucleoside-diphosphate-sugar epimerase